MRYTRRQCLMCIALAALACIVLALPTQVVAAKGGGQLSSFERFLGGRWLLRPVEPHNWVQPYTHEVVVVGSTKFDGECNAAFRPFYGADSTSSAMASAVKQVWEHVGPWYYRAANELWRAIAALTATPMTSLERTAASDVMPRERDIDLFRTCLSSDIEESVKWIDAVRNLSFDIRLNAESATHGSLTVTYPSEGNNDCPTSSAAPEGILAIPVALHGKADGVQTYRSISSLLTSAVNFTLPKEGNQWDASLQESAEASEANKCLQSPFSLLSFSAQFVDDSNALIHLVWTASTSTPAMHVQCPTSFLLKRMSATEESKSAWSLVGTLGLLVVVALFKFGPRMYFKWKGVNPALFMKQNIQRRGAAGGTAARGSEDLVRHAEFLRTTKSAIRKS